MDLHASAPQVVSPGDIITSEAGYMRGHGTFAEDGNLVACVAGVVERTNKVISVRPVRTRYVGEIGDVIVGRVISVEQRRWLVDTQGRQNSVLKLSAVNLPGGILRRRSAEDELLMRQFYKEGDLISAEVQNVHLEDGLLALHTRSLKYGKLLPGSFVTVPPVLVKRSKNHFHTLPCGVGVVLGNNGYIWVGPPLPETPASGDVAQRDEGEAAAAITKDQLQRIGRVCNVVNALARQSLSIFDTSIIYTYEDSEAYDVKQLLEPDVVQEITSRARVLCSAV